MVKLGSKNIPQKLERLLFTVARRYGVKSISVGAIILSNNRLVLDSSGAIPTREISDRDFNSALIGLIEKIGIYEFSISSYVGGFFHDEGTDKNGKKYYFLINADSLPEKLNRNFGFKHVRRAELVKDEAKMVQLAKEKLLE